MNQELAKVGTDSISSVLLLRRVHPCADTKTVEGRRFRKEEAFRTIEDAELTLGSSALSRNSSFDATHSACEASTWSSCDDEEQQEHNFPGVHVNESRRLGVSCDDDIQKHLCHIPGETYSGNTRFASSMDDAAHLLLMFSHSTPISP